MNRECFDRLFYPKNVAFVGASSNPGKWGFMILHHLMMGGYEGEVYPVNPRGGVLLDRPVYKRISDIPGNIEMAIFTVEAALVPGLITECGAKGVRAAVVISAGFKELGTDENIRMEEDMVRRAREAGMIIVGPNGQGIVNTASKLYPWMPSLFPPEGEIAIISQSGNLGTFFTEEAALFGMGISKFVSSGNQADLKMEDYLEYLADDDRTKAVICYIEGIEDGRRFVEKARRVTKKKPVVAIKSGRTPAGAQAAKSHTGAMASSEEVVSAAFRQSGVLRVNTIEEAWAVAATTIAQPLPRGPQVGVLTGGGGLGVLAADACASRGLQMAKLSDDTLEKLKEILPPWWVPGNPVDMVAGLKFNRDKVLDILINCDEIDGLFLIGVGWSNKTRKVYRNSPWADQYNLNEIMEMMAERDVANMAQLAQIIINGKKPIYPITNLAREAQIRNYTSLMELLKKDVYLYQCEELAALVYAKMLEYHRYLQKGCRP